MKKMVFCLFVLVLGLSVTGLWAQDFEIQPFIGAMLKSSIDVTNVDESQLELGGGFDWGFTAGGLLGDNLGGEFLFNSATSKVSVKSTGRGLLTFHTQH